MDKAIVAILGTGLIGAIYWFFFGKKDGVVVASGSIDIVVDGGYKPAFIQVKNGVTTTLRITRKDKNSCLEEIILPEFKIKQYLPLNETTEIMIKPIESGEFAFHCGMNMYHGKLKVE